MKVAAHTKVLKNCGMEKYEMEIICIAILTKDMFISLSGGFM